MRRDPYPVYRALHEAGGAHFNERAGLWFLSRHADCAAALRDERLSAHAGQGMRRRHDDGLPPSMLTADGADHERLRAPVRHLFGSDLVRTARPRVQVMAERLLDDVEGEVAFDALAQFARPLSAMVLADLLGIPGRDFAPFHRWALLAGANLDPLPATDDDGGAGAVATDELAGYLASLVEEARRRPRKGIVGQLVADARGLCDDELVAFLSLVVIGGYEPLANLVGNGLAALLADREAWERVVDDGGLLPAAVDEVLRFDPPIQLVARVATEDVTIGAATIRRGHGLVALLGAANRDASQFSTPDGLVVDRRPNPHLAFGGGAHFCLGAPLARVVGQVAIGALAGRWPGLAMEAGPGEWLGSLVPRGLERLPVRPGTRGGSGPTAGEAPVP